MLFCCCLPATSSILVRNDVSFFPFEICSHMWNVEKVASREIFYYDLFRWILMTSVFWTIFSSAERREGETETKSDLIQPWITFYNTMEQPRERKWKLMKASVENAPQSEHNSVWDLLEDKKPSNILLWLLWEWNKTSCLNGDYRHSMVHLMLFN